MARVCMHADIFADMQQLYKGVNVRKRESYVHTTHLERRILRIALCNPICMRPYKSPRSDLQKQTDLGVGV